MSPEPRPSPIVRSTGRRLLFAILLSWVCVSAAGDGDHDRARRALEAGEVLPLRVIMQRVERDFPGQVIEVELERDHGRWIYEIKTLGKGGSLVKLKVDAHDGRLLGVKGRAADAEPQRGGRSGDEH